MENASKALLMAAGVLIGVLILTLMVYLFVDFGTISAQIHSQVSQRQINEFNSKFTSYESYEDEGKSEITIYDVITVANYARENNDYYKESNLYDSDYKVEVRLKSSRGTTILTSKEITVDYINKLVQDEQVNNNTWLVEYKCEVTGYHNNGRVSEVIFSKK